MHPSVRLHFGTMGFGYADWQGVFYPRGIRSGDFLSYYSRYFDTVELDTTFYATPPPERVQKWAETVPDDFQFCAKTPKAITHEPAIDRRLGEMLDFLDVMRGMGAKLAAILLQFPPSYTIDQFEPLERFLKALPTGFRFAVEFRNASWGEQRTLDLLREHRCALVSAEYLTSPAQIYLTTDFLYIRWIGEHERFKSLNREQIDVSESLEWWKAEIEKVAPSQGIARVLGFFNNDYTGYAIATCRRFMRMMGLPVREEAGLFE